MISERYDIAIEKDAALGDVKRLFQEFKAIKSRLIQLKDDRTNNEARSAPNSLHDKY